MEVFVLSKSSFRTFHSLTEEALKSGKPVKALDFVNCVKDKLNVDDKIMQAIYGVVVIKPKVSEKRDSNEPLAKGY